MHSVQNLILGTRANYIFLQSHKMVAIAQLVRASDCGSEGRGFEPHWLPTLRPWFFKVFLFWQHWEFPYYKVLILMLNTQLSMFNFQVRKDCTTEHWILNIFTFYNFLVQNLFTIHQKALLKGIRRKKTHVFALFLRCL